MLRKSLRVVYAALAVVVLSSAAQLPAQTDQTGGTSTNNQRQEARDDGFDMGWLGLLGLGGLIGLAGRKNHDQRHETAAGVRRAS